MVFGDRNARVNTGRAVAVATVAPFDPDATDGNRENNGLLRNLIDGKGETNWYTEGYGTRNLGGKSGVGFILRLRNERTEVNRLRIDTASGGWSAQIYVSDTDAKSLDGWGEPVGRVTNADRGVFSAKLTPTRGSVVLLWITDLGPKPANAKYIRVIINEVSPRTT